MRASFPGNKRPGDWEMPDNVTGNTCRTGASSKDAFTGTPNAAFGNNQGRGAPQPKAAPGPK
jgi:hypothetical protein